MLKIKVRHHLVSRGCRNGKRKYVKSYNTEFYRPRGVTCPTKREPAITKWIEKHIMSRPDLTNYRKSCEDACNGVLFLDDSQVVGGKMRKRYAPRYSEGYTVIRIREVEL